MIYEMWKKGKVHYAITNPLTAETVQRHLLASRIRQYQPDRIVRTD